MKITTVALLFPLVVPACATTGSAGGSKGSVAPFQGFDVVEKRRQELLDANKLVNDCLKMKAGEAPPKGGFFAVTANASGKLTGETVAWDGPADKEKCIVDKINASTITPLPGPSVGTLWQFTPPTATTAKPTMPEGLDSKMQKVQNDLQVEVEACAQQNLPPEMPADIEVGFFVGPKGNVFVPNVLKSTSKDGGYDSCVQDVIRKTKIPATPEMPLPLTLKFHVGRLEKL